MKEDVVPGSLVILPCIPGIREPRPGSAGLPAAEALGDLAGLLKDYRKRLADAADARRSEHAELAALLKSRSVREKLRAAEEARPYADRVSAALKDREAEHEQRQAFLKQLDRAPKDLAELAKRLS